MLTQAHKQTQGGREGRRKVGKQAKEILFITPKSESLPAEKGQTVEES